MSEHDTGSFNVVLIAPGNKKIPVIKLLCDSEGLRLKDAKALVDGAPAVVAEAADQPTAESLKADLEKLGAAVELRHTGAAPESGPEQASEALVAKYAPGLARTIKLYSSGRIESPWGAGSVVGASARVDQSGSKHVIRDTRQTYITIEGPHVAISQKLASNASVNVTAARRFAATVNKLSQERSSSSAAISAAGTAGESDAVEQIRRLGELRDQGLITPAEFEAKKAELLGRI